MTTRVRLLAACLAAAGLLGAVLWFWSSSLVPSTYSVMDMGSSAGHHGDHRPEASDAISVAELAGPQGRPADVSVTLTARAETLTVGGRTVEGYTLNGTSPGPTIRVGEGELLEVTLVNDDVAAGVTLHWHGVDLPNAEDGVAGVTQDAVAVGGRHRYRFVAEDPGTYWYHAHQASHEQVRNGFWGVLVVEPRSGDSGPEVVAATHDYDGIRTLNGVPGPQRVDAAPGSTVRVRVVNTDNAPLQGWVAGTSYRLLAVDARDLNAPGEVSGEYFVLAAGGRYDLEVTVPGSAAAGVVLGSPDTMLVLGSGEPAGLERPDTELDLLSYGEPRATGLDVSDPDRDYDYDMGRRIGFLDGRPGMWWTINGKMFPDVPAYEVAEGDVVKMTIRNDSGDGHPMHLHGHHVLVLSRDGEPATGSPWWTDSLQVDDGETFEIAFLADNPGIWMDHCHNLPHAAEGLVTHLSYEGVTTPYVIGGHAHNEPE